MTIKNKALLALLTASIIWGFNPIINKILINDGTALTISAIRFFLGSFTLMAILAYKKQLRLPPKSKILPLVLIGILTVTIFNTFTLEGLRFSSVTNFALINSLSPLSIAILACLFLRERLLSIQWIGIIISLCSTAYLITNGRLSQITSIQFNRGDFIFFIAQLSWAVYTLLSAKMIRDMKITEVVAWSSFFGACVNVIYGLFTNDIHMPNIHLQSILAIGYLSWVSSMGAMLLWNVGIKSVGPSIAGIFLNLTTLIAISAGVIIFNEEFNNTKIIGGIGILFGVVILTQANNLLKWKKNRSI